MEKPKRLAESSISSQEQPIPCQPLKRCHFGDLKVQAGTYYSLRLLVDLDRRLWSPIGTSVRWQPVIDRCCSTASKCIADWAEHWAVNEARPYHSRSKGIFGYSSLLSWLLVRKNCFTFACGDRGQSKIRFRESNSCVELKTTLFSGWTSCSSVCYPCSCLYLSCWKRGNGELALLHASCSTSCPAESRILFSTFLQA